MKITIWESNDKKRVIRLPNWIAINGKTLQFISKKNDATAMHCNVVDDNDSQYKIDVQETDEIIDITLQPTYDKATVETASDNLQVAKTPLPKVPRETVRNIRKTIKQMHKIHKDWVLVDVQDANGDKVVIEL